jgi:hypothetical protein
MSGRVAESRLTMSAYEELKAKYIQGGEASPLEWAILWGAKSLSAKAVEAAAAELAELRAKIARLQAVEEMLKRMIATARPKSHVPHGISAFIPDDMIDEARALLDPEADPLPHIFNAKTMLCIHCGIYYGDDHTVDCPKRKP